MFRHLVVLSAFSICFTLSMIPYARWKREAGENFPHQCYEKYKPELSDIEGLGEKKLPETKEGKCFMTCTLEEKGLIKNGKMDVDTFVDLSGSKSRGVHRVMEVFLSDCEKTIPELQDDDPCDKGVGVMKCMYEIQKMGEEDEDEDEESTNTEAEF